MVQVQALNGGRRKRKDGLNFVVCQVADPGFADTDGKVGQLTLFLQHFVHLFFKGAGRDEAINHHIPALTDSPCSVRGLIFYSRIPPKVIVNDGGGGCEV